MDTASRYCVRGLELFWADAAEMAMATRAVVEVFDVGGDIRKGEFPTPIDVLLDSFLLQAAEEGLRDRIVPAVSRALMLGSR